MAIKRNSHKVTVKPKFANVLPGENLDRLSQGIGSSFRNKSICKGLNPIEEDMYMPELIGMSPKDQGYTQAKLSYWKNLSRKVPNRGLELEVGFIYPNEEAYNKGKAEELSERKKIDAANAANQYYEECFYVRGEVGKPIDVNDYVLWRYLLVYGECANRIEDQYKSARIRMYIVDKKSEELKKVSAIQLTRRATRALLEMDEKPTHKSAMLMLMRDHIFATGGSITTPTEKEIALDLLVRKHPQEFLNYAQDKRLMKKAFIMRLIDAQLLRRIPNTSTILYGDNQTVGNSLDEVVDWLFTEVNLEILTAMKAQLKMKK